MKTLYLIRHAKSSWADPKLPDFDRPLNKRGLRDAPFMGKLLKQKGLIPDCIVSSPAVRALTTARSFADEMALPYSMIKTETKLYDAGLDDILAVIRNTEPACRSLMVFGHNPGLTICANHLGNRVIDKIATSGVFCVKFKITSWMDVNGQAAVASFYLSPKNQ